jgi:hypothetical protein
MPRSIRFPRQVLLLLVILSLVQAQSLPNEHQVKAAFLINLVRFVEWPHEMSDQFKFCVLNDDRLEASLRTAGAGKTAASRDITVRKLRFGDSFQGCAVIYVGGEHTAKPDRQGILTVGDSEAFEKQGGMITLSFDTHRLQFTASLESIRGAGLRVSANLLRLAKNFRNEGFRAAQ